MSLRSSTSIGLGTSAFTFGVCLALGMLAVAANDWFGSGDLLPFAIYSVPFSLGAWPLGMASHALTRRWPLPLAILAVFAIGLAYGVIGTFAVALCLGPWFGAMSVPMLRVWCSTGALTLTLAVLIRRCGFGLHTIVGAGATTALAFLLFFALQPTLALATGNQHLTVVLLRHHSGSTPLSVSGSPTYIDYGDLALLTQTGLQGVLEPRGSHASNSAQWPRAKALIVFTEPLPGELSIPQPKHCSITYVQDGQEFRRIPHDAPTLARTIRFYREGGDWHIEVEHASGARSGGFISP